MSLLTKLFAVARSPGRRFFCLLSGVTIVLSAQAAALEEQGKRANPRTIIPHQTTAYVRDKEAAFLLDELSEFKAQLMAWNDTELPSARMLGVLMKAMFMPFARESLNPGKSTLDATGLRPKVSEGFLMLNSPRIVRIDLGPQITLKPFAAVDIVGGEASVPFVVTNSRPVPVVFSLRVGEGASKELRTIKLRSGQTFGFFWDFAWVDADSLVATASYGEEEKEFTLPCRRWEAATVRVRVLDERGKPTPARVYLTGADGKARAPKEVMHRIVTDSYAQPYAGEYFFYTPGEFEVRLPVGATVIEAVKGMEYYPERTTVDVSRAGSTVELRLRRLSNLKRAGWFSGETHVHMNLFGENRMRPEDALIIAKAEDLNVINSLNCNDPATETINDQRYFEGRPHAVSEGEYILYFGEEMRNNLYGHVGFLNLKSFVEPAYSGWPRSKFPYDSSPNYYQAIKAKAQGGVVTYVHPGSDGEWAVDFALQAADSFDVMCQGDEENNTRNWYRLLNCGFRVPISAGTDSFLNVPEHLIAGAGRVYVQSGPRLTYGDWIEGFKKGRSFATNGPLLTFSVDGCTPGNDAIVLPEGGRTVDVKGEAISIVPMDAVEIVVNGKTVRRIEATGDKRMIEVTERLEIAETSWVAFRVRGSGHRLAPNDGAVYAHTSPVYVQVGGRPLAFKADALHLDNNINRLIMKVRKQGIFEGPDKLIEVEDLFRKAQGVYRDIADRAAN